MDAGSFDMITVLHGSNNHLYVFSIIFKSSLFFDYELTSLRNIN